MNLYICDYNNGDVHVLSPKGQEHLYTFGKQQLQLPHSIHISYSGGLVYVSSWKTNVFTKEGKLVASFGHFGLPCGLVLNFDTDGFFCM